MSGPAVPAAARPGRRPGGAGSLQPEDLTGEIDTALRQATDAMSRATNLLALALAPRVSGARLCHVELLTLHPDELMYVFIVSTGGVMKGVIDWPRPVDLGLVEWARTYLNETLNEHTFTARLIRRALEDPELSPRESRVPQGVGAGVRTAGGRAVPGRVVYRRHVSAAGGVRIEGHLVAPRSALAAGRAVPAAQGAFGRHSGTGAVVVRIGSEHEATELQPFSMVAASYGLPQRRLGTVSLVGPTRMDYEKAIATVRETAQSLSELVEERYE